MGTCTICLKNLMEPTNQNLTKEQKQQQKGLMIPGQGQKKQYLLPEDQIVVSTKCGHLFHKVCLRDYVVTFRQLTKQTFVECPICQERIIISSTLVVDLRANDGCTEKTDQELKHAEIMNRELLGQFEGVEKKMNHLLKDYQKALLTLESLQMQISHNTQEWNTKQAILKDFSDMKEAILKVKEHRDIMKKENLDLTGIYLSMMSKDKKAIPEQVPKILQPYFKIIQENRSLLKNFLQLIVPLRGSPKDQLRKHDPTISQQIVLEEILDKIHILYPEMRPPPTPEILEPETEIEVELDSDPDQELNLNPEGYESDIYSIYNSYTSLQQVSDDSEDWEGIKEQSEEEYESVQIQEEEPEAEPEVILRPPSPPPSPPRQLRKLRKSGVKTVLAVPVEKHKTDESDTKEEPLPDLTKQRKYRSKMTGQKDLSRTRDKIYAEQGAKPVRIKRARKNISAVTILVSSKTDYSKLVKPNKSKTMSLQQINQLYKREDLFDNEESGAESSCQYSDENSTKSAPRSKSSKQGSLKSAKSKVPPKSEHSSPPPEPKELPEKSPISQKSNSSQDREESKCNIPPKVSTPTRPRSLPSQIGSSTRIRSDLKEPKRMISTGVQMSRQDLVTPTQNVDTNSALLSSDRDSLESIRVPTFKCLSSASSSLIRVPTFRAVTPKPSEVFVRRRQSSRLFAFSASDTSRHSSPKRVPSSGFEVEHLSIVDYFDSTKAQFSVESLPTIIVIDRPASSISQYSDETQENLKKSLETEAEIDRDKIGNIKRQESECFIPSIESQTDWEVQMADSDLISKSDIPFVVDEFPFDLDDLPPTEELLNLNYCNYADDLFNLSELQLRPPTPYAGELKSTKYRPISPDLNQDFLSAGDINNSRQEFDEPQIYHAQNLHPSFSEELAKLIVVPPPPIPHFMNYSRNCRTSKKTEEVQSSRNFENRNIVYHAQPEDLHLRSTFSEQLASIVIPPPPPPPPPAEVRNMFGDCSIVLNSKPESAKSDLELSKQESIFTWFPEPPENRYEPFHPHPEIQPQIALIVQARQTDHLRQQRKVIIAKRKNDQTSVSPRR